METSTVSIPGAAKLTGASYQILTQWREKGLVPIASHGEYAGGKEGRLDLIGLLVIGLIQMLRKQGVALGTIRPIAEFISGHTAESLERHFGHGEVVLVSAMPDSEPCLVPLGPQVKRASRMILHVQINLEICYRQLQLSLAKHRDQPSAFADNEKATAHRK